jgi:hypothetical protein
VSHWVMLVIFPLTTFNHWKGVHGQLV